MRLLIAGGRDYFFSQFDRDWLDEHFAGRAKEVVQGEATGADYCGRIWGERHRLLVHAFPALWDVYGLSAGYRRNKEMAEFLNPFTDAVVLFPGNKGTANMKHEALKRGLTVYDHAHLFPKAGGLLDFT